MKKVYVGMSADLLHAGHINVLKEAKELGHVIVGLLSDEAIASMEEAPFLSYKQRKVVLENLDLVDEIVEQKSASYRDNLLAIKPDYVVHGDDWKSGYMNLYRREVVEVLHQLFPTDCDKNEHPNLIEVPYSSEINALGIKKTMNSLGISQALRSGRLRKLLAIKKPLRILETHSALVALIAENTFSERDGKKIEFDGFWQSSLTDSSVRGKPDIEAVDLTSRLNTVHEIFDVTSKPMIYDADTGGKIEHFVFTVKSLERAGVSAVVIEDKTGLKKNSLLGNEVEQTQDSVEDFCQKITAGKKAQVGSDFMIFARIESLILDKGQEDALMRAQAYIKAGADGIMIHSRHKDGAEIFEFMKTFRAIDPNTPVLVVPTSFNTIHAQELADAGVNIVVYANQMLRASFVSMSNIAQSILDHDRSAEIEKECLSINEILSLIPGTI